MQLSSGFAHDHPHWPHDMANNASQHAHNLPTGWLSVVLHRSRRGLALLRFDFITVGDPDLGSRRGRTVLSSHHVVANLSVPTLHVAQHRDITRSCLHAHAPRARAPCHQADFALPSTTARLLCIVPDTQVKVESVDQRRAISADHVSSNHPIILPGPSTQTHAHAAAAAAASSSSSVSVVRGSPCANAKGAALVV